MGDKSDGHVQQGEQKEVTRFWVFLGEEKLRLRRAFYLKVGVLTRLRSFDKKTGKVEVKVKKSLAMGY